MGCAGSREQDIEERHIIHAEQGLNFYSLKAVDLDSAFRKYNSNGYLSQSQLIHLSNKLNFKILNYGRNMHIQSFFQSIQSNEGNYDIKDLLLIAILLGKGDSAVKARLIYEIFDQHLTHQIDIEVAKKEIITRMINHSTKLLPNLVCSEMAEAEVEMKIHKYKNKILDMISPAIEELTQKLIMRGNVISQDTFVEVFSTLYNGELVTTTGLRKYLQNLGNKDRIKVSGSSRRTSEHVSEE